MGGCSVSSRAKDKIGDKWRCMDCMWIGLEESEEVCVGVVFKSLLKEEIEELERLVNGWILTGDSCKTFALGFCLL